MQTVSQNWKNAHKQTLLNESFVEVSLDIADPDSAADATAVDNGSVYISNTWHIAKDIDKNILPYCTLEQNLWLLDGTRKIIPESDYGESGYPWDAKSGYVGDVLSDDECAFSDKVPVITIGFSWVFDALIPGITITWGAAHGEYAEQFDVIAYNGDTVVAEKEVVGNRSVTSLVMVDIVNYDRIVIRVKKWCLPHHRARVDEIFVGIHKVYSKTELFNYVYTQSVDPLSTSLPQTKIKFSIDNASGEYNPYNESGLSKYLMERQEIRSRYGLKLSDGSIEWIKGGTFYLSEWYAKQNGLSAEFVASDLLGLMSDKWVDSYPNTRRRSFASLAFSALQAANLPLRRDDKPYLSLPDWFYDESMGTTAPLPNDTLANCLQLIANAAECVLYQDRDGVLHIEPLRFDDTDYEINSFNSYSKSEITVSKPIKQVVVKVYSYSQSADGSISSATTDVAVDVGDTGETIVVDNPLVDNEARAKSIGEWVGTHLGHRLSLDSSWRADVRLDALDIVTNKNAYNTNAVRMTDVEYSFSGAFRGTGKGKVI